MDKECRISTDLRNPSSNSFRVYYVLKGNTKAVNISIFLWHAEKNLCHTQRSNLNIVTYNMNTLFEHLLSE